MTASRGDRSRAVEPTSARGQVFGQYVLQRRIAQGGMAEIFLAKQTGISGFERLVVVKRILPHLVENREFITMFLDEARIAAQLTHPNIVQIYDLGRIRDAYYIAMEYIHGEDFRKIYNREAQRGARVPVHFAVHLVAQAALGLDYAHRRVDLSGAPLGFVHRDVSPQNLLVTYDGHVKVVDFGVAKAANKISQTRSGVLKGKYSYMSPEQAQSMKIDARTDVFALAVVLYEVTCGVRLFKRENELDTLQAVIDCEITPPSRIDPGYPPALEKILLKALSKNPARRHQSAGELASDLEEFLKSIGKSVSPRDIALYMQHLFADKLAEERLVGHGIWDEEHTSDQREARVAHSVSESAQDTVPQNFAAALAKTDPMLSAEAPRTPLRQEAHALAATLPAIAEASQATPSNTERVRARNVLARDKTWMARFSLLGAGARARVWLALAALGLVAVGVFAALIAGRLKARAVGGPTTIETRPAGARVLVDGEAMPGETPMVLARPLSPGRHHLRVEREGFRPEDVPFDIAAKKTARLELDLKPLLEAPRDDDTPEPPLAAITAPLAAPRDDDVKPPPAAPRRGSGVLVVKANVPLRIYEGKALLGTTPLTRAMPGGRHVIRALHEPSGWSATKVAVIDVQGAGVQLAVPVGKLRINVQPFAKVYIGTFVGETPMAPLEWPAGRYAVRLTNEELGREETVQVRINENDETVIERSWLR